MSETAGTARGPPWPHLPSSLRQHRGDRAPPAQPPSCAPRAAKRVVLVWYGRVLGGRRRHQVVPRRADGQDVAVDVGSSHPTRLATPAPSPTRHFCTGSETSAAAGGSSSEADAQAATATMQAAVLHGPQAPNVSHNASRAAAHSGTSSPSLFLSIIFLCSDMRSCLCWLLGVCVLCLLARSVLAPVPRAPGAAAVKEQQLER